MKRAIQVVLVLAILALICLLLPAKKQDNSSTQERQLSGKEVAILELAKLDATATYENWIKVLKYCRDSSDEVSTLSMRLVRERSHQDDITSDYVIALAEEVIKDLDYNDRIYSRFQERRPFVGILDRKIAESFLYVLLNYKLEPKTQETLLRLIEQSNESELFFFLSMADEENFSLIQAFDTFSPKGQACCLRFLGMFKDKRGLGIIIKRCTDESRDPNLTEVTLAAVEAAGEIGVSDPELIAALQKRLQDWKISVVIKSIHSLMKLKDHDAVPTLSRMLSTRQNFVASQEVLKILKDLPTERIVSAKEDLKAFLVWLRDFHNTQDGKLLLRDMPDAKEIAEGLIENIESYKG